ncbi:MAG: hypothetical protein IJ887_10035 [Prevotella sp.]|nr:hypothetical protein [Prevotella sp.]
MMKRKRGLLIILCIALYCTHAPAQTFLNGKLRRAAEVLGITIGDSANICPQPGKTVRMKAKDGHTLCLRTTPGGVVEHVGIPLFNDSVRQFSPLPVYDFMEFALLNWRYKVMPNSLYLSKVVFRHGGWETLLKDGLDLCECSVSNYDDRLYILSWLRDSVIVAQAAIPIDYELLNNDSRRNMERDFVRQLADFAGEQAEVKPTSSSTAVVNEDDLCLYGTEGLFVIYGETYILDELNQNVYYTLDDVSPTIVVDSCHPAETLADMMMATDESVPDITLTLDFHLSDYSRQRLSLSFRQLKDFCHQRGCKLYFACRELTDKLIRGTLIVSNRLRGYNHLVSINMPREQLTATRPEAVANVYLYIPPIEKPKLFGKEPNAKSGAKW